jgi:hypothetical protein
MFLLQKYHDQIDAFICSRSSRAFLIAFGLLVMVVGGISIVIFRMGSPPMNGIATDVPVLLDGAWRVANGQVPHRDFYNFLGDLPYYVVLMSMKVSRPCASAIDYGNALLGIPLSIIGFTLLRHRTTALCAFLFSCFIALLVMTPRALGSPYDYIDHAMLYNRYGETFMALLAIILFLPRRPGEFGRMGNWGELIFVGFLLVAALGCKINYFVVSIGFFLVACFIKRFSLGGILVCVFSAGAFLALALTLTGIPFAAMMHDYHIMSGCQSLGEKLGKVAVQGAKTILWLPLLLLSTWEAYLGHGKGKDALRVIALHVLVITVIVGGAILLLAANAQTGEVPLLTIAGLYGFEVIQREPIVTSEAPLFATTRYCFALLLVLLFLLPSMITSFKTFRYAMFAVKSMRYQSTETLQSTQIRDFRFVTYGTRNFDMADFMASMDDGIQLLRRHLTAQTPVNILLFANPFHLALGWRPPVGGTVCAAYTGFSKRSHPSLTRLLGNAPYLLIQHEFPVFEKAYGAEWGALHLRVIEDTKYFTLYSVPEGTARRLATSQP